MWLIAPSVSGIGEGVRYTPFQDSSTVVGEILPNGLIKIAGTLLYDLQFWRPKTISKVSSWPIRERLLEKAHLLHWSDIMAVYLVSLTNTTVSENSVQYNAGARKLDELEILSIIDAIAASSHTKDWNMIMAYKNLVDPIDDTSLELSSKDVGTVQKITETITGKPWYQEWARKLLSDTQTQLYVMAGLVLLLIIKSRQNG